ncbi:DUF5788 family protein [Methanolobus bombayensis]|uniref:DUF5788 family protein n=1 Tax=Methanolobus bombayensis TaxID=38023 RepID=UPI001AE4F673|nr:DUF5788 family protein [Methanolobus bombayensis]MBP1910579.1 hypothetical protein [Methanolobus bombayensis]
MKENGEISKRDREKLLKRLHSSLFWVGEEIPYEVKVSGEQVHLHEIVWEIVNKPELDKEDIKNIDKLLEMLSSKEKEYEERLENEHISCEDANDIFEKAAGIRRAIMDLRELTISSKRKAIFKNRQICDDVDTSEWDSLAEDIKEKCKDKR